VVHEVNRVLLIETLAGVDHPEWYVFGADCDAKLISMCETLPHVFAEDGRHFRPQNLNAWRTVFSAEPWLSRFPDRPMRALDCLDDERYWLLIHEPPRWGPMGREF